MENEVSTSRATAAWVRASVSTTSTSSTSRRSPLRGSPPAAAVRVIALVIERGTSQGSVSPNCQGRRPPVRSEEHTSELQTRGHLVCRLLLEINKQNHR